MGKDTFFFEEDPAAGDDSGVTGEEQADTFLSVLAEGGIIKDRSSLTSFDPMKAAADADTKKTKTAMVEIEYGIVKGDYVIHVVPTHPHKNLKNQKLLEHAIRQTVLMLNKEIPGTLKVDIYLPRADFEIKATSYVVRDAADAWNFDATKVEALIPAILEQVGKICMMA